MRVRVIARQSSDIFGTQCSFYLFFLFLIYGSWRKIIATTISSHITSMETKVNSQNTTKAANYNGKLLYALTDRHSGQ